MLFKKNSSGWLYLIRNGDLYKIGITKNFEKRMRQLKPDSIVAKLYSRDFKFLEREFHKRYRDVRIPQTEYFRLDNEQIRDITLTLNNVSYPLRITFGIFINSIFILLLIFLILLLIISLTVNDINIVIMKSLFQMSKIALCISIISLFIKSGQFFNFWYELKFRLSRGFIILFFSLLFRLAYSYYFDY